MEDLASLLATFHRELHSEILELYQKFYNYILELLEERDIGFSIDNFANNNKDPKEIIEKVIEITDLALMTIGVPKAKLSAALKQFKNNFEEQPKNKRNYYKDFNKYLKLYIEQLLLEILLEYLINIDSSKMKKLYLFDLLPHNFISKLDKFKQEHDLQAQISDLMKEDISDLTNYVNPSDFTIDLTRMRADEKIGYKPTSQLISQPKSITQEITKTFLSFNPIKEEILKKFIIDKDNLININNINHEFFDLQNLFYVISILKMLNVPLPFKVEKIIYILKNYINEKIFCSSIDGEPDPISNYFGLSILSELNLLNDNDIINVSDVQLYLESELKNFIPDKLHLNFYSILCLLLLEKSEELMALKSHLITPLLSLDIFSNKESINQITDIFDHLTILKLLDETIDLNQFKFYTTKLINLITQNNNFCQTITDSARLLLIFDLLDLKKTEFKICKNLFNFITKSTRYFNSANSNSYFNWKNDKIAFTIELRMLFWALIAGFQYFKLI